MNSDSVLTLNVVPTTRLTISGPDGKQLHLDYGSGELKASGDLPMDEAAQQFFNFLKPYVDSYIASRVS